MDDLAALTLQIAWGADEALEGSPVERMLKLAPITRALRPFIQSTPPAMPSPPSSLAADCANSALTIAELHDALAKFCACPLAATATNLVFADGTPAAGLVVVDETPGPEEDSTGRPMSGPPGRLLDRMLASIGLNRSLVLVTNLVPWRPPGGRPVTDTEVAMCLPFLRRHLALLRPRMVLSLGPAPAKALSGTNATMRRLRGQWQKIELPDMSGSIAMLTMTHPAVLLRTPAAKKEAWVDLLALQKALKVE